MKKYLTIICLALMLGAPLGAQDFLKGKILYFDDGLQIAEREGTKMDFSLLGGMSSQSSVSLLSVERALEKAAEDDEVALVFLRPDNLSASLSAREELRECLARLSKKGKPVVAYGVAFSNASYYLGSVADRLFWYPGVDGTLSGLSSSHMYYKDLLDTLGLQVQLIRHGSYKSAGEPYIRSEMSRENREQYEALFGSIWNPMVDQMAASRGISADSLQTWINTLQLATTDDWLEKGLIDGVKYRDEMQDYLCHLFGKRDVKALKAVPMSEYIKSMKNKGSDKVAVLYAEGEIVRSGSGIAGEKFARQIAKVRADSTVKAVVFRVNSPGGEVVASDMIRREIELLRKDKPVIASYGAYAASGGYLISAGTDHIFVDDATLTGSIGVFGQVITYGEALKKNLHINTFTVGTNDHSDMGAGIRPLNDGELTWYQGVIDGIYDQFVGVVSQGRDMPVEEVEKIAQGRVWSGKDALQIGLADEKGTLMDAVRYAAGKAGLDKYRIVTYPAKKSLMDELLSMGSSDKEKPLVRIQEVLPQGFSAVARMPYFEIDEK